MVADTDPVWAALGRRADGRVESALLDADGAVTWRGEVPDLPEWVAPKPGTRWVWADTPQWYEPLLRSGVRVDRCHDLRLCHAILRDSAFATAAPELRGAVRWDVAPAVPEDVPALFDLDVASSSPSLPEGLDEIIAEFGRQRALLTRQDAGRLRLLAAAESAGALIAVEMRIAGLPWDAAAHDEILTEELGARPGAGGLPRKMEEAAARVRDALGDPRASLDSPPKLLRSLHRVGVHAQSTSRWELAEHDHPVIEPLLEYRRLARLLTANGWGWLDEWVRDGRFRPVYVPAGVVTGRWASSGGGALQIPRRLRPAARADDGWMLVVADVAQLEPRVLAAMARDLELAAAARGKDLYAGIVERGAVATRPEAKVAMLGAMYGATTGESGRLLPALRRAFPKAMALVDEAAARGEDGGRVSTWLGRTSPAPSASWDAAQARATDIDVSPAEETAARRWARDRGRFTRNFVVQGTAAEWALAWLADIRLRLAQYPTVSDADAADRSGPVFGLRPHLAFYLHDEIIVHTPVAYAEQVAADVRAAAASAGALLFGSFPIDFPLDVRIARTAAKV